MDNNNTNQDNQNSLVVSNQGQQLPQNQQPQNQPAQDSKVPPRQPYQPAYYPIGAPPQKNPEEPIQYPVHIKAKKRNKPPRGMKGGHTPIALPKLQKAKNNGSGHGTNRSTSGDGQGYTSYSDKANVVVIGNSGVGKSTLINSVFRSEEMAETGIGEATTKEMRVYESEDLNFRLIDTMGFEHGIISQSKAILAVKKWSKESIKNDDRERQINVIWYCIDGTSRKMFKKNIDMLARATSEWRSVPIIVVITKSYSKIEREENIAMVKKAFAQHKTLANNLKAVIPVVSRVYKIDDGVNVTPEGLAELLCATEKVIPEGIIASQNDIQAYEFKQKRVMAQSVIATSTAAAVTIGAVPIPIADGALLTPLEVGLIKGLSQIYGVEFEKNSELLQTLINAGAAGIIGKTALSALKAIPGINIAVSALNAIVAGSVVYVLGQGTVYVFEKIYSGEKKPSDVEWVRGIMESNFAKTLSGQLEFIIKDISFILNTTGKITANDIMATIIKHMKKSKG